MNMRSLFLIVLISTISIVGNAGVYVIGDFNDWAVPTKEVENGALRLSPDPNFWQVTEGHVEIDLPAGSHEFTLVYLNDETGKINSFASAITPNFVLTTVEGYDERADEWVCLQDHWHAEQPDWWTYPIMKSFTYCKKFDDIKLFKINDWGGGKIVVATAWNGYVTITSPDAPDYEPVTDKGVVYALAKVDDFDPVLIEMRYSVRDGYQTSVDLFGHKMSVIFTTEKSLNPEKSNCWGPSTQRLMHYNEVKDEEYHRFRCDFVRGGQPFEVEFDETGCVNIVGSWTDNDGMVNVYEETLGDYVAELTVDGRTWSEPAEINHETGFFEPVEVTGGDVGIMFKANTFKTGWSHEGDVKCFGKPRCDHSRLYTDEKMPEYDADKVSTGGMLPYEARFETTGSMTMTASPYYGIGYIACDGEVRRIASIEDVPYIEVEPEAIEAVDENIYYDLNGKVVVNPQHGIYLFRRGEEWKKTIIK